MIYGSFRSGHPHVQLEIPGISGPLFIYFIVDTGFDGDFALPADVAYRVQSRFAGNRERRMADNSITNCPCLEMVWVDACDEERIVEILIMDGAPLIGTQLLFDHMLQIELTEGGSVTIEPL